jgi:hypothetical protein
VQVVEYATLASSGVLLLVQLNVGSAAIVPLNVCAAVTAFASVTRKV